MREVVLKVQPVAGGWRLDCDLPLEPTYFRCGAHAVEVARALALHLRGAGHDVRLQIRDRTDHIVEVRRYAAI